jgi:hypothetical protein
VWIFSASFQYPWTCCFFRHSLLCVRIHEFPIFVIAYLQGWALAAGIEKERTGREGGWATEMVFGWPTNAAIQMGHVLLIIQKEPFCYSLFQFLISLGGLRQQ